MRLAKKVFITLCIGLLASGCATTKGVSNAKISESIELQNRAISDPLFGKILRDLEMSGDVDWQEGSTSQIKEDLSKYTTKTEWLLSQFQENGAYPAEGVSLWRKWNPFSSTNAATFTCGDATKLNKWRLDRDKYSWVNTLVHERVHSFCLIHPEDQTRDTNKCDISYLSGDLAEIILIHRDGIDNREFEEPRCPALVERASLYIGKK